MLEKKKCRYLGPPTFFCSFSFGEALTDSWVAVKVVEVSSEFAVVIVGLASFDVGQTHFPISRLYSAVTTSVVAAVVASDCLLKYNSKSWFSYYTAS